MLELGLEVEVVSTAAINLERFIKKQINEESDEGSDGDSDCLGVIKGLGVANHHTTNVYQSTMFNRHKDWLVEEQTALGKDFSNPFIWLTVYQKLDGTQLTNDSRSKS